MALAASERARFRPSWRMLAQAAVVAAKDVTDDPTPLSVLAHRAHREDWPGPYESLTSRYLCSSLVQLSRAYGEAPQPLRALIADPLKEVAELVSSALDESAPDQPSGARAPALRIWWVGDGDEA